MTETVVPQGSLFSCPASASAFRHAANLSFLYSHSQSWPGFLLYSTTKKYTTRWSDGWHCKATSPDARSPAESGGLLDPIACDDDAVPSQLLDGCSWSGQKVPGPVPTSPPPLAWSVCPAQAPGGHLWCRGRCDSFSGRLCLWCRWRCGPSSRRPRLRWLRSSPRAG